MEWNEAEEALSGLTRAEVIGRPLWEIQNRLAPAELRGPGYMERVQRKIMRGLAQGDRLSRVIEEQIECPDGTRRIIESHMFAIRRGGELFAAGIRRDVTERKRAEQALRQLADALEFEVAAHTEALELRSGQIQKLALELEQAEDRERRKLAAILHEDLQQQLAAASYKAEQLRSRCPVTEGIPELVEEIGAILRRAGDTARSLSHQLHPGSLQGKDIGQALQCLAEHMRQDYGLTVRVAAADVEAPVEALAAFLFRAARELLFNVVKHAGVGIADLRLCRIGDHLALSVSDSGRGFDPRQLGRSHGSGLMGIKERTELLGGRMTIHSDDGKGSVFQVMVPLPSATAAAP